MAFLSTNTLFKKSKPWCFIFLGVLITLFAAPAFASYPAAESDRLDTFERILQMRSGENLYGLSIKNAKVKSGQTLSLILRPYNIPSSIIHESAVKSKKVFDVRRIKAGNTYSVIFDSKVGNKARYFIYDKTPETFVLFDFLSPVKVYMGKNQIEIREKIVLGKVKYSLWKSLQGENHTTDLINNLANVFSGSIDFNRMQKNDYFQVLYEEKYANGDSIGIKGIKAATITTNGMEHEAFYFSGKDRSGYYDAKGESLEKTFLKTPLKYTRLTSGYKPKRLHPITKKYCPHPGIDYAAPTGTPVKSVSDGIVCFIGRSKSAGNYIKISHGGNQTSEYLHLSRFARTLKVKRAVKKGSVIGYVGQTGWATGPHLDFRFKRNGRYVDYSKLEFPSGEPLDEESKIIFSQQVSLFKTYIMLAEKIKIDTQGSQTLSLHKLSP